MVSEHEKRSLLIDVGKIVSATQKILLDLLKKQAKDEASTCATITSRKTTNVIDQ